MNGSYEVYRQASLALAYPQLCYQTMGLQPSSDVLQLLHQVPQMGSVHVHKSIQKVLMKMDESPIHNVLVLHSTRFPLETCLALMKESCEDSRLHPVRDRSQVQAWHSIHHPHPRHVQIRLGCYLQNASRYQSLPGNDVPFPGFHVVQMRNRGFHRVYRYLQKMLHHRLSRSALQDHRERSISRPVELDLFLHGQDGCYRNHRQS